MSDPVPVPDQAIKTDPDPQKNDADQFRIWIQNSAVIPLIKLIRGALPGGVMGEQGEQGEQGDR